MEFKLPELGEGVHEGELIKWKVKPGDSVTFDQSLCEIMTDKATVEIPSAIQGKVGQLHAKEGETVHVGQLLLSLEGSTAAAGAQPAAAQAPAPQVAASGGVTAAPAPAPASSPAASRPSAPQAPAKPTAPAGNGQGVGAIAAGPAGIANRVLAAPSTRRLAREQGIDLGSISGSGPHGRVLREDLSSGGSASAKPALAKSTRTGQLGDQAGLQGGPRYEERVPLRGLRKKIAEKMRLSKDHAAHFTYVEEADATELVALRSQAKEIGAKQGIKVTFLPFVMKAMVAALKQYPILNASLDEEAGEIVYKHYYNIGLSIQTDDGLTAPVVKDVASKSIWEIASEIQDLVDRARAKKLTMDDFHGGSITLTNAGSIGGLFATPIINYPEVAILGFNKIFRKPVAKMIGGAEQIVVRDWTYFSISLDHRIVDGAVGAEFMKTFIRYIETPALLVLEA